MNTFDIIVLILLALGGITGFRKGLLTGMARLLGEIAAIAAAVVFHMRFLDMIEPVFNLRGIIEPKINSLVVKVLESKAVIPDMVPGDMGGLVIPVIEEATVALTDYILKIIALIILFLLASFLINLLISLLVTPLAKSLGIVNRGGGLAFGFLTIFIVLSLIVGMASPVLTAASAAGIKTNDSLFYPILMNGYEVILSVISVFAGDFLANPLEMLPQIKSMPI